MKPILRAVVVIGALWAHSARAQVAAASGAAAEQAAGSTTGNATSQPATAAPATKPAAAPAAATAPAPTPAAAPTTKPAAAPVPTPVPATINLTPTAAAAPTKSGAGPDTGVGLSPSTPALGGDTMLTAKEAATLTPSTSGAADEWKFDFHGYLRAPLRASIGPANPVVLPSTYTYTGPGTPAVIPPGSTYNPNPNLGPVNPPAVHCCQLHGVTRVPGALYTNWDYTNTVTGPWSQLNFIYGNSRVTATVIVDAYNQTDGSYRALQDQQGIDQAFVTMNFPDVFGDYGGLVWNVGTFQNRYGTAGKYDGGMYETYLFGRTHQTGETLTANLTNLDAKGDWSVTLEQGIGEKMDITPFLNDPYYQVLTNVPSGSNSGKVYLSQRDAEYLPYAGPVPMGSTFIVHAHAGAKYQKLLTLGAHYLFAWTPDDNWDPINSTQVDISDHVPRSRGPIQGSMAIAGVEARLSAGEYGEGYLGYSHIDARNINAMSDIIEVLHSYGGYQFKQNYFGETFNNHTGVYNGPENETGTVDTVSLQYSFSFGALARAPEDWWGDGPDLVLTGFGLFSIVNSPAPPATFGAPQDGSWDMSTKKLKFGLDAVYTPLYYLGFGGRFDAVLPDLDSAYSRTPGNPGGSSLDFGVLTGRMIFKTAFVTHESITLEYQHYLLGKNAFPSYPYEWVPQADANLVAIYATMWW